LGAHRASASNALARLAATGLFASLTRIASICSPVCGGTWRSPSPIPRASWAAAASRSLGSGAAMSSVRRSVFFGQPARRLAKATTSAVVASRARFE